MKASSRLAQGLAWVNFALILFLPITVHADDPRSANEKQPSDSEQVSLFLDRFCTQCHDTATAEGDREFESFQLPLESSQQLITADEIIDQLTLRQMPPEGEPQPTDQERQAILKTLRESIEASRDQFRNSGGHTVMRRLSQREYENTLATLFGRRVDTLGLTADFPKERTSRHIDTIGQSLITSGFLLDQYFQAANRLVELRLGTPGTEPQDWHFTENFVQYEELGGPHRNALKNKFLCIYEQPNTDTRQGSYGHIEDFLEGVPVSGVYDIR